MKRTRKTVMPAPPTIEQAIARVQGAADSSMLPQMPYADYIEGYGWAIDSTCRNSFPSNAKITWNVTVLPTEYFRGWNAESAMWLR